MKTLITPVLLSLLLAVACKKYVSNAPHFGDGSLSSDATAEDGGGDDTGGGDDDGGGGSDDGGDDSSPSTSASSTESIDTLTVWSGSSLLSAISGDGYKIDGKAGTITPISKGLVGSLQSSKSATISSDQISELMALVTSATDGKTSHTLKTCDSSKLLGELYISVVKSGTEELILNADTATCVGKRYISNASFEKVTKWITTNFPPATTTGATTTSTTSTSLK